MSLVEVVFSLCDFLDGGGGGAGAGEGDGGVGSCDSGDSDGDVCSDEDGVDVVEVV